MKRLLACLLLLAALAPAASGEILPPLRSPQVPFKSAPSQELLNEYTGFAVDQEINVLTQQRDLPTWSTDVFANSDVTLVVRANNGSALGVCNTGEANPTLLEVFPAGTPVGSYAAFHTSSSGGDLLVVSRFDPDANFLGQSFYHGFQPHGFAFYVDGPCGTRFSEDARNTPAGPQGLVFALPHYDSFYDFWVGFASCPYAAATSTFADVVLQVQLIIVVPARNATWGQVKAQYR